MDYKAIFKLTHGLYVVGVKTETGLGGCIVDAVAQITSTDPPVIILASMINNYTNERIKLEKEFTISILSEKVDPFVIGNFGFQSSRNSDKWADVPYIIYNGLPILNGASAYLYCRLLETREFPSHSAFFCEITEAWDGDSETNPLTYRYYQDHMKNITVEAFNKFKENGPASAQKEKWQCSICGHIYEGDIPFEDLPSDWVCPQCGLGKEMFEKK
jgi:flavin reductase (DIM6/NTAB) family NADH-FMN oxidoreductase RutF/rubredoxin